MTSPSLGSASRTATRLGLGVADWLFGGDCLLCSDRAQPRYCLCVRCAGALPWHATASACQGCGEALPAHSGATGPASARQCGRCLADRTAISACICALRYRAPVDALIWRLKFHDCRASARGLAEVLADACTRTGPDLASCRIVPMPLHPDRTKERGFNQCTRVARWLARETGTSLEEHALARTRSTPPQASLRQRGARLANVAGAFAVPDTTRVAGRSLWLLDDVVTTGATVRAAAAALHAAGAARIGVLSLARA